MDARISTKERRKQPEGPIDVYVNDVFDIYPIITEDNVITDIELYTNTRDEYTQYGLFGSLKQRGSDPIHPKEGNRWVEVLLEELPTAVIMSDIPKTLEDVRTTVSIQFFTKYDEASKKNYLLYDIKVVV